MIVLSSFPPPSLTNSMMGRTAFSKVVAPVRFVMEKLSEGILRLLGGGFPPHTREMVSEAEFRALVDAGEETGTLDPGEKELIHNIFEMTEDERKAAGIDSLPEDLHDAIMHGAVKRIRPKMMTVTAAFMGLLPIMWSTSAGADVMKRIAAPMIGGLVTSFILELLVYPAIYKMWKQRELEPAAMPAES